MKTMPLRRSSTFGRNSKDLTDPYTLMLEGRLNSIRPDLSCLSFEDPYLFAPIDKDMFLTLRKEFEDGQSLQLISQRSRPGAFLSPNSLDDPNSSGPGVVEIKVVKAGFLYKAEGKRKNIWREWGIILTASQLYFFKDTAWFKSNIMNQQQSSFFSGRKKRAKTAPALNEVASDDGETQAIIRPMVDGFHPHTVIPTTEIVALFSTDEAPKNKNCVLVSYKSGDYEWFSSNNETDLNDWALKINFAASFNTYYVVGISSSLRRLTPKLRALKRNNSDSSTSTWLSSNTTASVNKQQEYSEVHLARKLNVEHKLSLIEAKIDEIQEQLNEHIRTRKSLQLLAPIQLKTREAVFSCAANLTAALKWKWLQRRKLLCYKQYFELDLEVEKELCSLLKPADTSSLLANGTADEIDDKGSIKSKESIHTFESHEITVPIIYDNEPLTSPTTSESLPSNKSDISFCAKSIVSSESGGTAASKLVVAKRSKSHYHSRSLSQGTVSTSSRSVTHRRSQSQLIPKRFTENHSGDDVSASVKRMPLTLRDSSVSRRKTQTGPNSDNSKVATQRSTSLIRNKGDDITLMGKKFHVVEVNPEFGTSKQSKSIDDDAKADSINTFTSSEKDFNVSSEKTTDINPVSDGENAFSNTYDVTANDLTETEDTHELLDVVTANESSTIIPVKKSIKIVGESTEFDVVEESHDTLTLVSDNNWNTQRLLQSKNLTGTSVSHEEKAIGNSIFNESVSAVATKVLENTVAQTITEPFKAFKLGCLDNSVTDASTENSKFSSNYLTVSVLETEKDSEVEANHDAEGKIVFGDGKAKTEPKSVKTGVANEVDTESIENADDRNGTGDFILKPTTVLDQTPCVTLAKPHEDGLSEKVEFIKAPKDELPNDSNTANVKSTEYNGITSDDNGINGKKVSTELDQTMVARKIADDVKDASVDCKDTGTVKNKSRHYTRRSKRKGSRRIAKSAH